jgi:hypothetical protein
LEYLNIAAITLIFYRGMQGDDAALYGVSERKWQLFYSL